MVRLGQGEVQGCAPNACIGTGGSGSNAGLRRKEPSDEVVYQRDLAAQKQRRSAQLTGDAHRFAHRQASGLCTVVHRFPANKPGQGIRQAHLDGGAAARTNRQPTLMGIYQLVEKPAVDRLSAQVCAPASKWFVHIYVHRFPAGKDGAANQARNLRWGCRWGRTHNRSQQDGAVHPARTLRWGQTRETSTIVATGRVHVDHAVFASHGGFQPACLKAVG